MENLNSEDNFENYSSGKMTHYYRIFRRNTKKAKKNHQ